MPWLVMPWRQSSGGRPPAPTRGRAASREGDYPGVLAVFYDIHANLPALEAVVAEARAKARPRSSSAATTSASGRSRARRSRCSANLRPATWIRGNGERWLREPPMDRPEIIPGMQRRCASRSPRRRSSGSTVFPERAEVDGVVYVHGCWHSDVDSFAREPQPRRTSYASAY